ncbi:unnamed protein product [Ambrosiozyma monospora]|uniref:Altered inheritance of mitochondria protein 23, mitochondrial n=1 Tax=Ambrosiozyma monospora TaxID=43982 RepID=A0A9W6YY99_AMBMO|nr:unnamed protein product [Ambrosiozyma monospora]
MLPIKSSFRNILIPVTKQTVYASLIINHTNLRAFSNTPVSQLDLESLLAKAKTAKANRNSMPGFNKNHNKNPSSKTTKQHTKSEDNNNPKHAYSKGSTQQRNNKGGNKRDNNRGSGVGKRKPREKFLTEVTGTMKDRLAFKEVIQQVMAINKDEIKVLDTRAGRDASKMVNAGYLMKTIDLNENGIQLVSVANDVPLVKIISSEDARKNYSDFLAGKVNSIFQGQKNKLVRDENSNEENGETDIKMIRVSWQITNNDFSGQKKNEIVTHYKKGETLQIVIDDNDNFDRQNNPHYDATKQMSNVEKALRGKVIDTLNELLTEELGASFETSGDVNTKLIYNLKPLQKKELSKDEKRRLKQLKKMEKQEKLKQRLEKKKAKQEDIKMMVVD